MFFPVFVGTEEERAGHGSQLCQASSIVSLILYAGS